jgi:hypothetical protein
MADTPPQIEDLVHMFARAETLARIPEVVDIFAKTPPNPPEATQIAFVGSSYVDAYAEAASFVRVAQQWLNRHAGRSLGSVDCVLDFGAGWGRISRMLLAHVGPATLYTMEVDQQMTALIASTLPGVGLITVRPYPPTVLRDRIADAIFSFSVFSHLSPSAHIAWAEELGRLVSPGGMVFMTVLDEAFLDVVESAQRARDEGSIDPFAESLASCFPDINEARRSYQRGEAVFCATGGGGVRSAEFYGWTAAPPDFVKAAWTSGGMRIVEWVPSGTLFPQAMVGLMKPEDKG